MSLLERDEPLATLRTLLAQAGMGRGNVAAILGEAGVGKTSLVRSLASVLPEPSRLLQSACEDLSIAEPLGPLRDLAREVGWNPVSDPSVTGTRLSLFSDALEVFSHPDCATVLVVEDVHWADDATLDFLRFLTRRIRGRPILLVLTTRSDDAEGRARLRRVLGDAPPDSTHRIVLAPLSRAAVAELAHRQGADPENVYSVTGGNAFFVNAFLEGGATGLPLSVQDTVLRRADRLPRSARSVLEAVAVSPRQSEAALVDSLCGTDFSAGLEVCIACGLLNSDGGVIAFRHELARQAIELALPPLRRIEMNTRLLHLLQAHGDVPMARLLHHAKLAQDATALRQLAPEAAAEAARLGAHREAAEYYRMAIEHGDHLPPSDFAALQEAGAWSCYTIGRHERATALQTAALEIYRRTGDRLREGDALRKLSRFSWNNADRDAAEKSAHESVRVLADQEGPELAMAHSTVSQLLMLDYRFDRVPEHAERAIALAETFDCPSIVCHALNNLGMSRIVSDPEQGRSDLTRSLGIATRINSHDDICRAFVNAAHFEYFRCDFHACVRSAREGVAFCAAHEQDGFIGYQEGTLAWGLLRLGRWDEAQEYALQGFHRLGHEATPSGSFTAASALVWLESRRGLNLEPAALPFLNEFTEHMQEMQRTMVHAAIMGERAWLGLEDKGDALERLKATHADARSPGLGVLLPWILKLDPTQKFQDSPGLPAPYRYLVAGDWLGAAEAWAALGAPYDEALALAEGDASARQRAHSILVDLGATRSADVVRAAMQRDGLVDTPSVPRASTRANPAGLTLRQMDVLNALNEGLSNSEIGERLFIAPKTVDHHVSAILGKLDVASRGEAAAKARQIGLI